MRRRSDLRSGLNAAYDAYVQAHGYIGENIGVPRQRPRCRGWPRGELRKTAIGAEAAKREGVHPRPANDENRRSCRSASTRTKVITRADSVEDECLSERGKVDPPYIAGLVGNRSWVTSRTEAGRRAAHLPRPDRRPTAMSMPRIPLGERQRRSSRRRPRPASQGAEALEKVLPEPLAVVSHHAEPAGRIGFRPT